MKRTAKIIPLFLAALLLLIACGFDLAQPERRSPELDRLIGFHLVYEKLPPSMEEAEELVEQEGAARDYSQWTDYGQEQIKLSGIGTVSTPRKILIGQWDEENRRYIFPGLEGKNCFLAVRTMEDGSQSYSGYSDMADAQIKTGDGGESISGTIYSGPPLDDQNWNTQNLDYVWTAYRVYQMVDGTVYLTGGGNSYGGAGGFTVSEKTEEATTENGEVTTSSFEATFTLEAISRLDFITIKQYDKNDQLLRTDVLTADQAAQLSDGLRLTLEPEAEYVLIGETDVEGKTQRTVYPSAQYGERYVYFVSWFLDDAGEGYGVPIWLEP